MWGVRFKCLSINTPIYKNSDSKVKEYVFSQYRADIYINILGIILYITPLIR